MQHPLEFEDPHFAFPHAPFHRHEHTQPSFRFSISPTPKPKNSFCLYFSRSQCNCGDSCTLNHQEVTNIICKHALRNRCKFGESCIFKHPSVIHNVNSKFTPVVQRIVQENISLFDRRQAAKERIQALEAAVKFSPLKNHQYQTPDLHLPFCLAKLRPLCSLQLSTPNNTSTCYRETQIWSWA